ncbi:unnamed protein product [Cunninghamella blakesleeana]
MSEREIITAESIAVEPGPYTTTTIAITGMNTIPLSRPPSYKLHTNLDMDAIETQGRLDILSLNNMPFWYRHFNGAALVFWLLFFVILGTVTIFIPALPSAAYLLWLPLLTYFIGLLGIQFNYRQRLRKINHINYQLSHIRHYRLYVAHQSIELPDHMYFLHYQPNPLDHPYTTLLPPPPSYQPK